MNIQLVGVKKGIVKKEGQHKGKDYIVLQTVVSNIDDSSYIGKAVKEVFLMGQVVETVDASMLGKNIEILSNRNYMTGFEEIVGIKVL